MSEGLGFRGHPRKLPVPGRADKDDHSRGPPRECHAPRWHTRLRHGSQHTARLHRDSATLSFSKRLVSQRERLSVRGCPWEGQCLWGCPLSVLLLRNEGSCNWRVGVAQGRRMANERNVANEHARTTPSRLTMDSPKHTKRVCARAHSCEHSPHLPNFTGRGL